MNRAGTIARVARCTPPLRLYYFASFAALGVYSPFFPRWLVARGIEGVAMGAVVATMPAMGVIGPPLVGLLADSLGLRGSLLRVACLGSFLAFFLLAVAGLSHHELSFVEIFTVVLAFAAFRAPMLMMADVMAIESGENERAGCGGAYGKARLWGSVGFLVASIGGGRCVDPESPAALPTIVAAPLLVALLAACAIPVQRGTPRLAVTGELRSLLAAADFRLLLCTAFVAELSLSAHELCYSLYLSDVGASGTLIGLAWGAGVGAEILVMAFASPLLARFREPQIVVFALCGTVIRCALLSTLRSVPALLAVQMVHSPSITLFWIAALSHLKRRTSARTLATAQGIFSATNAAGSVAGMLVWGAAYRHLGGGRTFGTAAVVATLAALLGMRWAARARR
jgi:PPP family 3-phenylpropionic acid transporter